MSAIRNAWLPVAVITACSLTLSAQPAGAKSTFDQELSAAANHYTNVTYGTTTALNLWFGDAQTLTALTPQAAAAVDKQIPNSDAALNKQIINKTNALAEFVKDVTGYDPRNPAQLTVLHAALRDYSNVLDTQRDHQAWAAARNWFDSLEYRQYASVNGHDEFRRRVLSLCGNCAKQIAFSTVGAVGGVIYNVVVNGNNTRTIINAGAGVAIGFLVGVIVGVLDTRSAYTAGRVEVLARDTRIQLARLTTLALIAAQEAEQAADLNRAELGQHMDRYESVVASTSTFTGRLQWLWKGHVHR